MHSTSRRVTAFLAMMVVPLAGGLALAQDAPPQEPPSAPSTTAAPGQSGAPAQPETPGFQRTITGDAAVWAEVQAVYGKLDSLSGYRKKESGVETTLFGARKYDTTDEIVPLKAHHSISESQPVAGFPGVMGEVVVVGNQSRSRRMQTGTQWGPWECVKAAPVRKPGDTGGVSIRETVEASRRPDTAVEGTPMRTYVYTTAITYTFSDQNRKPSTVTGKTTLYVDTQTGLLRRSVFVLIAVSGSDKRDFLPTTEDFYDYDAKIDITLPPCEKEL